MSFSSLENILNCQAEYSLITDISVEKFNECLIEKHCPISKFALKIRKQKVLSNWYMKYRSWIGGHYKENRIEKSLVGG